jgi:hypothetical protein
MSKRKDIIREYDRVKIVNPQIFVRSGYPLTIQMVKDTVITKEQKDAIWTMLKSFNVRKVPGDILPGVYEMKDLWDKDYSKVMDVMARIVLRQQGWGGSERKIYTEEIPGLLNATGEVWNKRVVKTGIYCAGCTYKKYWDEYDEYDPPGLADEKTHVILKVYVTPTCDNISGKLLCGGDIEIEKCNVVKIDKSNDDIEYIRPL